MKKNNPDKNKSDKKNKSVRKTAAIINSALILSAIFGVSTFLFVGERPTISEEENRTLAKMPEFSLSSWFDGSYSSGVSEFFNDTVPMRSVFKSLITDIRACFGVTVDDASFHGTVSMVNQSNVTEETTVTSTPPETSPAVTTTPAETQSSQTQVSDTTVSETQAAAETVAEENPDAGGDIDDGHMSNGILVYKNRALMLYGSYDSTLQNYASYVNAYKTDLGNTNVYSMVIPTAVSYYLPEKYSNYSEDQLADIEYIRTLLDGVKDIDVASVLAQHVDEDIYSRTDHHWAPLGAYYAAQTFVNQLGLPFADLSTYEKIEEEGYVGTMYSFTQDPAIKNNPETFIYYKPSNSYTTTYYDTYNSNGYQSDLFIPMSGSSLYVTFMGGDDKITHINTDCKNGRNLCIIKDSFGNALVPFLTGSFENIYVIDMRYFNVNAISFMKENNVTDLLFASCSFTAATPSMIAHIEQIRTQ